MQETFMDNRRKIGDINSSLQDTLAGIRVVQSFANEMCIRDSPYTIPQALLAEKVCKTIGMDKIFYQNSGTEANEAMIKMARKYGIEKYLSLIHI